MEKASEGRRSCVQRGAQSSSDEISSCVVDDDSQKNNKLAFEESVRAITSLYEGDWRDRQEIVLESVLELTMGVSAAVRIRTKEKL